MSNKQPPPVEKVDQLRAALQECRDAIAVSSEAQSGARDGYRDVIKKITADRDDLRMRLEEAKELLVEIKTRLYGHVPLANAQHIDLFRRICALLDATEQQRIVELIQDLRDKMHPINAKYNRTPGKDSV